MIGRSRRVDCIVPLYDESEGVAFVAFGSLVQFWYLVDGVIFA